MAVEMKKNSHHLLTLPLEVRHRIFCYVFVRREGSVLLVKQQLEHMDSEIDTSDAAELYADSEAESVLNELVLNGTTEQVAPMDSAQQQTQASQDGAMPQGSSSWTPHAPNQNQNLALWDQTDTDHQQAAAEAEHEGQPTAVINGQTVALVSVENPESEEEHNIAAQFDSFGGDPDLPYLEDEIPTYQEVFGNGPPGEVDLDGTDDADDLDDFDDEDDLEHMEDIDEDSSEQNQFGEPEGDVDGMKTILNRDQYWWNCSRATKYRHTVPIIQLSDCPPPVSLLLSCKQLCAEALEFYYAKCGLYIDATVAFPHFSFYEEVLKMLSEKQYSFVHQLRRAHVRFVWDSETIPRLSCSDIMTEYMLPARRDRIIELLSNAPHLKSIEIHWHDAVKNAASEKLKNEVLSPMVESLSHNPNSGEGINVTVKEYYPDEGQKLGRKSLLGSRRSEYESCEGGHIFR